MNPMTKTTIALIGAGVIGKTHVNRIGLADNLQLAAIADPTEAGQALAASVGVPWFADHRSMLDAVKPQGAIVATPNQTHVAFAIDCLERGAAALVEKPVASDVQSDIARNRCHAACSPKIAATTATVASERPASRDARSTATAAAKSNVTASLPRMEEQSRL